MGPEQVCRWKCEHCSATGYSESAEELPGGAWAYVAVIKSPAAMHVEDKHLVCSAQCGLAVVSHAFAGNES